MSMSSNLGGTYQPTPQFGSGVGFGFNDQVVGDNTVADQTQQMAQNPIYGQNSPFQPPMPAPNAPQTPNTMMPDMSNMGFGKSMGGGMIPPGVSGLGQVQLDANGQPIAGSGTMIGQNPLQGSAPFGQPVSNVRQANINMPSEPNQPPPGISGLGIPINNPHIGPAQRSNPQQVDGHQAGGLTSGHQAINARQIPIRQKAPGGVIGGPVTQQRFTGGLKQTPQNYRPPQGTLRSYLGR